MALSGFIIHDESIEDLMELSTEEKGQVLEAVIAHYQGEDAEELESSIARVIARSMKRRIDYDLEKYKKKAESGAIGGSVSRKNKQTVSENKQTVSKNKQSVSESKANDKQSVSKNKQTVSKDEANGKQTVSENKLDITTTITTTNTISTKESKTYSPDPGVNDAIIRFIDHRKKMKKPLSDYALEKTIAKLNSMTTNPDEQIAILQQSIDNCWQGIFPVRERASPKNEDPRAILLEMMKGGEDDKK